MLVKMAPIADAIPKATSAGTGLGIETVPKII